MSDPITLLLVDDEPPALRRLQELLEECAASFPHTVIGTATNGVEALEFLANTPVHIVITDIHMPDMSGLELARHICRLHHRPAVIFCTAFDQFAVQAFEVHAVDYLLKPLRKDRLEEALLRTDSLAHPKAETLEKIERRARRYFSVSERGRVRLVPVSEVVYLKAELKYVTLRTRDGEFLLDESLTLLETEFGERLVRIHRNCLVSRAALLGFERSHEEGDSHWHALLDGVPEKLAVSRRQAHVVKEFRNGG